MYLLDHFIGLVPLELGSYLHPTFVICIHLPHISLRSPHSWLRYTLYTSSSCMPRRILVASHRCNLVRPPLSHLPCTPIHSAEKSAPQPLPPYGWSTACSNVCSRAFTVSATRRSGHTSLMKVKVLMDVYQSTGSEGLQTLGFLEGVEAFDLAFFEFVWVGTRRGMQIPSPLPRRVSCFVAGSLVLVSPPP